MERIRTLLPLMILLGSTTGIAQSDGWTTPFELDGNRSASYTECHDFFLRLAGSFPQVQVDVHPAAADRQALRPPAP